MMVEGDHFSGLYMAFYNETNMPREKGYYKQSGLKDGEWFYWKDSGELERKEIWKNGKLQQEMKLR